ncbi:prepilin peptidase [Streptomyces sp. NPDC003042]
MSLVLITLAAAYGIAAGLLLPRPAYRLSVPPEDPWQGRCPDGHPLAGWLGPARCPGRGPTYGPRPALAAAVTAAATTALGAAVGPRPEAVVFVVLTPVLVLLSLVDLAVHRLPDVLTLPLGAAAAALLGAAALLPGSAGSWRLALLGGGALWASYLLLHLINPAGLARGDVKLALPLGVALGWYGWGVWMAGAFLGFLYGAVYGLALVLRGRATSRTGFAFGPFMAAGTLTGLLLGGFGA